MFTLALICAAPTAAFAQDQSNIRLTEIDDRSWLIDPRGKPFFAHGITHVGNPSHQVDDNEVSKACKDLGFNAYGYGCPRLLKNDMPYLEGRNLVPISTYRNDGSFRFIDIFDPKQQQQLEMQIRQACNQNRDNPNLIGYCWTDLGAWPLKNATGKNWVDFTRALPAEAPGHRAYQAFLEDWRGDDPAARDAAFLRLIAREYFRVCGEANRKYDPNHLIFGDRFAFNTIVPEVLEEMLPWVDAIAIQPPFQPGFPKQEFDRIHRLTGKPILICDFAIRFKDGDKPISGWKLQENARVTGQLYEKYVRDALATSYILGVFWCNLIDSQAPFKNAGIKQGMFEERLTPRPGLAEAVRELNRYREQTTPKGLDKKGAPRRTFAAKSGAREFTVTVDEVFHGNIQVTPPVPANGQVEAGTVLTMSAEPDPGYAIDSVYYAVVGYQGWTLYLESMTSPFEVRIDQNMRIGASFIKTSELEGFRVVQDVVYAQPGVKPLKYDVYSPDGAKALPCIVIIHGGGWSANTEDIMRGLARELVKTGDYVVFSIDYRWMNKRDGDEKPNTMVDLIEDVFGAIAHIQEHADHYGADPTRIAVTGDSAGGHLSASVANMAGMIGDRGFGVEDGVFEYRPTYLPKGKTVDQVRQEISGAIRAAAPSYGVFDGFQRQAEGQSESWRKAICPIETIPNAKDRLVPQFLLRGTKDWIKHEAVQAYADALHAAGQPVQYVQVENARHAFLDWKPDPRVKATFQKFGVPNAAKMKAFFDFVFCAEREESDR
jgi:acetyl esterase/lipase